MGAAKTREGDQAVIQRSWYGKGERNWDLVWGSTNRTSHRERIHSEGGKVRKEKSWEVEKKLGRLLDRNQDAAV